MDSTEILKIYSIVYKRVSPTGTISMSSEKQKIEAKNNEAAIEILRSTVLEDGDSGIRIDRIENLSVPKIPEKKRKRSVLGWLAAGIFVVAALAKLLTKLF